MLLKTPNVLLKTPNVAENTKMLLKVLLATRKQHASNTKFIVLIVVPLEIKKKAVKPLQIGQRWACKAYGKRLSSSKFLCCYKLLAFELRPKSV